MSLLDAAAPRHLGLGGAKPHGEGVADRLQLADAEHPRAPGGADPEFDALARERRREELAEAPLQQRNLAAQLEANPAVGDRSLARGRTDGQLRGRCPGDRVALKQLLRQAGLP